jgi:hypothetical protein
MRVTRPIAAASTTEDPPNFITTVRMMIEPEQKKDRQPC